MYDATVFQTLTPGPRPGWARVWLRHWHLATYLLHYSASHAFTALLMAMALLYNISQQALYGVLSSYTTQIQMHSTIVAWPSSAQQVGATFASSCLYMASIISTRYSRSYAIASKLHFTTQVGLMQCYAFHTMCTQWVSLTTYFYSQTSLFVHLHQATVFFQVGVQLTSKIKAKAKSYIQLNKMS